MEDKITAKAFKTFINPLEIPPHDFPLIVFSDQTSGVIEFLIKFRTKASWNHVMIANRPLHFVSQGNTYSEVGMERYMKKGSRLQFWSIRNLNPVGKKLLYKRMNKKLKSSKLNKAYDWLGIAGQALGIKWFNGPTEYCSEDVAQYLSKVLKDIPQHPSPQDLHDLFESRKEDFKFYGYWEGE